MKVYLPEIIRNNGLLDLSMLPKTKSTHYISVTGQDGSGKTSLRDGLAQYYSDKGCTVITAKSPCDKHLVNLLNNAISQNGYDDWYTEQLLFSFCDGLLSNYMMQIDGRCDYFICQRGPSDQYDHGITRSGLTYSQIHEIQRPDRLAKFEAYFHLNCNADVAWERICEDEDKDRYEYPEYFAKQVKNTKKLYDNIVNNVDDSIDFLRESKHYYINTTEMTIQEVLDWVLKKIEN